MLKLCLCLKEQNREAKPLKYANFKESSWAGRTNINIGDYMQFIAVKKIYDKMGINNEEVYYLNYNEIITYDGEEELILPLNYHFWDFVIDGKIAISDKIRPVFIGVVLNSVNTHLDNDTFLQDPYNKEYFLRHAPIGCRDESSYEAFIKNGIPAYINGCLTATFDKMDAPLGESLFFIDVPKALMQYIPREILSSEDLVFAEQQHFFSQEEIDDYKNIYSYVEKCYEFYKKNAKMIVTSRLHVALPCTAFGIPVIFVKDIVDERFAFMEHYLPTHNLEQYTNINWNPEIVNIESTKKLILEYTISRIEDEVPNLEKAEEITAIFLNRNKQKKYFDPNIAVYKNNSRFEEYATKHWKGKKGGNIEFALWGANIHNADYWKNYIEKNYPEAKLTTLFDRYRKDEWMGIPFRNPEDLKEMPNINIVVCAVSAVQDALELFKKQDIDESRFVIVSDCFISKNDIVER